MCGIAVVIGAAGADTMVARMLPQLHHRGPDARGDWHDARADVAIGHTRLSIIDLSEAGRQPMTSADGRFVLAFNGEIYNHVELRRELADYPYRSHADSEVLLAAWARWGEACLDRLLGMFAFVIWDVREQRLIAVRDRFGVKPMYYAQLPGGGLALASEIKALHAAGARATPDATVWASYLTSGLYEVGDRTFWEGVATVPAGSLLTWRRGDGVAIRRWYELAARAGGELDRRDDGVVREEYLALLTDSVRLRFRADVPVGINLSGGLDSSILLGLVQALQGETSDVNVFTFVTGDPAYDELPWVEAMLARTHHPLVTCTLAADEVPALAEQLTAVDDEPFGGIPTIAYAKLFAASRRAGVIVLLDGQGLDEQWAGYDYYRAPAGAAPASLVQGTTSAATRAECLAPDFARLARPLDVAAPFGDRLRDLQYRDLVRTKIPRALRFNDRVSMAASTELREPFLDHRLVELALRQPEHRKLDGDLGKRLVRELAATLLPDGVRTAPKRALQTPQREWLRGPLRGWADQHVEAALAARPEWFDASAVRAAWRQFAAGHGDNSFWVWQWLSVSLATHARSRA